jgi:hypothetical protein
LTRAAILLRTKPEVLLVHLIAALAAPAAAGATVAPAAV